MYISCDDPLMILMVLSWEGREEKRGREWRERGKKEAREGEREKGRKREGERVGEREERWKERGRKGEREYAHL